MKCFQRKVNVCYDGLRFGTRRIMNHDENARGRKLLQYERIITMFYGTVRCTIRYDVWYGTMYGTVRCTVRYDVRYDVRYGTMYGTFQTLSTANSLKVACNTLKL